MLFHLREDEIARAVEDRGERLDVIGRETLADVRDDRNAAAHAGVERDRVSQLASPIEQLGPMLGQDRFVGRDDVFARLEQLQQDGPRAPDRRPSGPPS